MTEDPSGDSGLTVAINAQLLEGSAGGIETNLLHLTRELSHQSPADDAQVLIGPGGKSSWLQAHTGPSQQVLAWPAIRYSPADLRGQLLIGLHRLRDSLRLVKNKQPVDKYSIPNLDRKLKELNVDLIHFPYQRYFPTSLPFIFEPWDLQHIHLPELFNKEEILFRNKLYSQASNLADVVVAATRTTKYDLVRHLDIPASRIAVIYRGVDTIYPPSARQAELELTEQDRASVHDQSYAFYPAKPWPHKNHERLFEALATVRHDSGVRIPLVCTGSPVKGKEGYLESLAEKYRIADQVFCLGYLPEATIQRFFANANVLVFPSLFEGLGIPLLEAMSYGVPIACSNVSCIPEVVGNAALMFDPYSPTDIAAKLLKLWSDQSLREHLSQKGYERAGHFSWQRAVASFRVLYRHVANRSLSEDDRTQLQAMFS
jgi:glycosyltransferase involved in cell wall biosynthesis